jgi:hypothetical protein
MTYNHLQEVAAVLERMQTLRTHLLSMPNDPTAAAYAAMLAAGQDAMKADFSRITREHEFSRTSSPGFGSETPATLRDARDRAEACVREVLVTLPEDRTWLPSETEAMMQSIVTGLAGR